MDTTKSDVAVIGGGVIGSAAACCHRLLAKVRVQIHKYLGIP